MPRRQAVDREIVLRVHLAEIADVGGAGLTPPDFCTLDGET